MKMLNVPRFKRNILMVEPQEVQGGYDGVEKTLHG